MALHGGVQRMGPTSRNLVQAFAVCLGAFVFPKPKPKPKPKPNPKPNPNPNPNQVCLGAFVFPAFLLLSCLNQQLRKLAPARGMCKPLTEEEREQRLTSLAVRKLKVLAGWD